MTKQLNIIRQTIFGLTIIFIVSTIFALTVGQSLPVEFKNHKIQGDFYYIVFTALPFAFLLTLFGTIKKKYTKSKNWTIGILTVLTTGLCFFILVNIMFSVGFGAWTNEAILYRHRDDQHETINQQIFDVGAFGYGGHRIAKLKPFLNYFQTVSHVDTTKIDKTKWIYVNEEADIHYP